MKNTRSNGGEAGDGTNFGYAWPMMPVTPWQIAFDTAVSWNEHMAPTAIALSREWHSFIQRRFEHDVSTLSKICTSQRPDEFWAAYSNFCQKAAEDYQKEFAEISRICTAAAVDSSFAIKDVATRAQPCDSSSAIRAEG